MNVYDLVAVAFVFGISGKLSSDLSVQHGIASLIVLGVPSVLAFVAGMKYKEQNP